MKQTVSVCGFMDAFRDMDRDSHFSYDGLKALYEYLEECEDGTGEEVELDVIAIYCEFTEYENLKEFQDNYGKEYKTLADIQEETTVIPINDKSFIIQDF